MSVVEYSRAMDWLVWFVKGLSWFGFRVNGVDWTVRDDMMWKGYGGIPQSNYTLILAD